jgi:hypothetical protein
LQGLRLIIEIRELFVIAAINEYKYLKLKELFAGPTPSKMLTRLPFMKAKLPIQTLDVRNVGINRRREYNSPVAR